jgi:hypothetical protein
LSVVDRCEQCGREGFVSVDREVPDADDLPERGTSDRASRTG